MRSFKIQMMMKRSIVVEEVGLFYWVWGRSTRWCFFCDACNYSDRFVAVVDAVFRTCTSAEKSNDNSDNNNIDNNKEKPKDDKDKDNRKKTSDKEYESIDHTSEKDKCKKNNDGNGD